MDNTDNTVYCKNVLINLYNIDNNDFNTDNIKLFVRDMTFELLKEHRTHNTLRISRIAFNQLYLSGLYLHGKKYKNNLYIDFTTCLNFDSDVYVSFVKKYFSASNIHIKQIERYNISF